MEHLEASPRLVDDLVAEGRLLDALDMLTGLNRERRDPDTEERLVLLRRDAFSVLEQSQGRASWPPEFDDPFAEVDGLVEIQSTDLTCESLGGAIQHHGHVLVRGLLSRDTADRLSEAVDQAFRARDAFQQGAPASETRPWFVPIPSHPRFPTAPSGVDFERFAPSKVMLVDSPRALFEVTEAFREAHLDRIVGDYLGDRPVMAENKCTIRRMLAEQLGKSPWHQEASVFNSGPLRTVNVWLALSPCGVDAPGFQFLPRRMDSILEPELRFGLNRKTVTGIAGEDAIVAPIYEPGDAVLFDEYLLHRTKAEPEMPELRRNIESWLFAPSGHPLRERLGPVVL